MTNAERGDGVSTTEARLRTGSSTKLDVRYVWFQLLALALSACPTV